MGEVLSRVRLTAVNMAILLHAALFLLALSPAICDKAYLQRAGTAFSGRPYSSLLTVTNGEQFGNWTWPEMCPDGFFAVGFSLRVESEQYGLDDTALNGIRLICAKDTDKSFLYSIESHTGARSVPREGSVADIDHT